MRTDTYLKAVEAQRPLVQAVLKKMEARGQLPDDNEAVEAMEAAMLVLRSPIGPRDRVTAARLILDFTQPKPNDQVVETLKTANDWLDEMAEEID